LAGAQDDLALVTEHVAEFSLAGVRALARRTSPRER
jgi:hypothetical protein